MTEKIVIDGLYKIFGSKPEEAMQLLAKGLDWVNYWVTGQFE